ncbi:SusC/RagA family TonB-linked outer membrane protein [Geofilum sp. OHC36d9]|uniref:SusC/RagA family TonB-linked outer membrane protein n=1 Tax=Geofilum sp. OHC36d9 TaxID=3458413 RepID=UPI004033A2F8
MKRVLILVIYCIILSVSSLYAQESDYMIAGTVMDENGETLVGVSVVTKGNELVGTITDIDGKFRLRKLANNSVVVFSFVGFESYEYKVDGSKEKIIVVLKEEIGLFDEVVVVGHSSQRKVSVVGAISSLDPASLSVPATSVTNMLGGRVPGIIAVTRSGEPGKDFSEFWIRGISTFGANQSALVLIDGVQGNLNDLDPADIESFSVLKDASSTAVYGVRGANGVVVVTTNRGKAGKLTINHKSSATVSFSARTPEYVDAATYAALANEARVSRGFSPRYTDVELDLFESGLDPDLYPNVNWRDEILKDYTFNQQHYLSASGGSSSARYFLSLGILDKDAIFKQDKSASKYDTNVNYKKYSFRANIDANLTEKTILSLGIDQIIIDQNMPGFGDIDNNDALWTAQANLTPVTLPVRYSDGKLPAFGLNGNQVSPYVQLNSTGYKERNRSTSNLNLNLHQDLDMIVKGLTANILFSYAGNSYHNIYRNKMPDLYYASNRSFIDGSLVTQITVPKSDVTYNRTTGVDKRYYFETKAEYSGIFGDHRVSALTHYYMENYKTSSANDAIASIPLRYQALSARATYSYKDTYLIEANAGYTGSENFRPGDQFGFFPAIALGWVPTQYKWTKDNLFFIEYLKIRGSIGKVGNDRIANNRRFPYLTTMEDMGSAWGDGIGEAQIGADNLEWESSKKYDVGLDIKTIGGKVELTADIFKDVRTGIFQERASIPEEGGLSSLPFANVGSMESAGFDGNISYNHKFSKDLFVTVRGNTTITRNEVTNWEQSTIRYPYQSFSGVPYGVLRGLIAMGLFTDEDDVESSPRQTFEKEVLPGDIKYKDVNGDGKIDDDDVVPLSYSNIPQVQYGFAAELRYKNWMVSAFFEGVGKVNFFYGGIGYYPFVGGETGNVLTMVADQTNRWTSAEISGTPDTENPNARFPRLSYGNNNNNNRNSTFWLADASYLRLKNVELSYRWSNAWLKNRIGMESATFSLIGDNLACWDKVKIWDPGQASSNGSVYPLQRAFTFQLNVKF